MGQRSSIASQAARLRVRSGFVGYIVATQLAAVRFYKLRELIVVNYKEIIELW